MKRFVVIAALLLAGAAWAQMPDPRQMSGVPRPDQAVDAGKLTVRVIHGALAANAAQGTVVYLVGVGADGQLVKKSGQVDAAGRAEFGDLTTDGTTVYYAYCTLDGDRLVSEAVILPPNVGVRLMLSGRQLDPSGKPLGEPIDDERKEADVPVAPAGRVDVLIGGEVQQGGKVTLREVGGPVVAEKAAAGSEGDETRLTASFEDVPPDVNKLYVVEVAGPSGRVHHSKPFQMSPAGGVFRRVIVLDRPLFAIQGGAQLDDEELWFEVQLSLGNLEGAPMQMPHGGLVLPLPVGFKGGTIKDEVVGEKIRVEPGVGVVYTGAVPPGQKDIVVQFAMPVGEGRVHVEWPMPLGLFQGTVVFERFPGAAVTVIGSVAQETRGEDGKEYFVVRDLQYQAGEKLVFDVMGLPMRPKSEFWTRFLIGMFVLLLLAAGLVVTIMPRRAQPEAQVDPAELRRRLEHRRDRLYEQLVALERSRVAYRVDEHAYDRERKALVAKLVVVYRELDLLSTNQGKGKAARAS